MKDSELCSTRKTHFCALAQQAHVRIIQKKFAIHFFASGIIQKLLVYQNLQNQTDAALDLTGSFASATSVSVSGLILVTNVSTECLEETMCRWRTESGYSHQQDHIKGAYNLYCSACSDL